MKRLSQLGSVFRLIAKSADEFLNDEGFKLSASLSYYTVFALGPVLIIIISLAGIFGREVIQGRVFDQLTEVLGVQTAKQVQESSSTSKAPRPQQQVPSLAPSSCW
jgi:membrane protein